VATTREQLHELLDTLTDEQVATVASFAQALSRGRTVVSVCEPTDTDPDMRNRTEVPS
jgi:hypothetical protein